MENITKILAAILALMMLLTACSPTVPAETTTAPTTEATTAPTTEPPTEPAPPPTTEPTEPPTEPEPDYPGNFTTADVEFFTDLFKQTAGENGPGPVNYYNRLMFATFSAPEEADLMRIFYDQDVDENQDLTDAEKAFLATQPSIALNLDVVRVSAAKMEATLKSHLGLSLEDMKGVGMDQLVYFKDTDCYYNSKGDTGIVPFEILGGSWQPDGTVKVYYDYYLGMENRIITLRSAGDSFYVLSNETAAEFTETAVLFPEAPEAAKVKALPENFDISTLVQPYWQQCVKFNNNTFYLSIPAIYPFSQGAINCQQKIYEIFETSLRAHLEGLAASGNTPTCSLEMPEENVAEFFSSGPVCYFGYTAHYRKGILSILIRTDDLFSSQSYYHVFNLKVPEGTAVQDPHLGASDEMLVESLRVTYNQMHAMLDPSLDFYQDNLKKTLSEDNIDACRVFYGEDGRRMVAAYIYTMGSVDRVERVFPLKEVAVSTPEETAEEAAEEYIESMEDIDFVTDVEILDVKFDEELTEINVKSLSGSDLAKQMNFSDEYLQNHFKIILVTYEMTVDTTVPNPLLTTGKFEAHCDMIQDPETGLWTYWSGHTKPLSH